MNFTFGMITSSAHKHDEYSQNTDNSQRIDVIIDSVERLGIPNYEIIIIGDANIDRVNTKVHAFDETEKPGWITKKKNLITQLANYENIVFLHDYVTLEENWYRGFLKFGDDWDICMSVIKNTDDTRFRDWVIFEIDETNYPRILTFGKDLNQPDRKIAPYLPPYHLGDPTKAYISGAYWVAKKEIMQKHPLNEELTWCKSEDIEWSQRVRVLCKYVMNPYSSVKLLKYKDSNWYSHDPYHMSQEYIEQKLL